MHYLIVSLISLLCGFAGAAFLFRRHYRNTHSQFQEYELMLMEKEKLLTASELNLKEKTEALQKIMYRTHHHGINPVCKRIRGLTNLSLMAVSRLFNFLEILSKPNHQEYSKLAMAENTEILNYLKLINSEALTLENDTLNKVKEFEHLQ